MEITIKGTPEELKNYFGLKEGAEPPTKFEIAPPEVPETFGVSTKAIYEEFVKLLFPVKPVMLTREEYRSLGIPWFPVRDANLQAYNTNLPQFLMPGVYSLIGSLANVDRWTVYAFAGGWLALQTNRDYTHATVNELLSEGLIFLTVSGLRSWLNAIYATKAYATTSSEKQK